MKKPVAIILVVVVLLAAGIGGWLWYQSHQDRGLTLYGNVDIRTVNMSFRVGGAWPPSPLMKAIPSKPVRCWECSTRPRTKTR